MYYIKRVHTEKKVQYSASMHTFANIAYILYCFK